MSSSVPFEPIDCSDGGEGGSQVAERLLERDALEGILASGQ